MDVVLWVAGIPRPRGSKRAYLVRRRDGTRIAAMKDSGDDGAWMGRISHEAMNAHWGAPAEGPVEVRLIFVFPRPLAHHIASKRERPVRAGAPVDHTKQPDIDKLARAVLDSLSGICYKDDRQVSRLALKKRYGAAPGVGVFVRARKRRQVHESLPPSASTQLDPNILTRETNKSIRSIAVDGKEVAP